MRFLEKDMHEFALFVPLRTQDADGGISITGYDGAGVFRGNLQPSRGRLQPLIGMSEDTAYGTELNYGFAVFCPSDKRLSEGVCFGDTKPEYEIKVAMELCDHTMLYCVKLR